MLEPKVGENYVLNCCHQSLTLNAVIVTGTPPVEHPYCYSTSLKQNLPRVRMVLVRGRSGSVSCSCVHGLLRVVFLSTSIFIPQCSLVHPPINTINRTQHIYSTCIQHCFFFFCFFFNFLHVLSLLHHSGRSVFCGSFLLPRRPSPPKHPSL